MNGDAVLILVTGAITLGACVLGTCLAFVVARSYGTQYVVYVEPAPKAEPPPPVVIPVVIHDLD